MDQSTHSKTIPHLPADHLKGVDGSQFLSREELQRIHASLYGHCSSLRSHATVATAVTRKAASALAKSMQLRPAAHNSSTVYEAATPGRSRSFVSLASNAPAQQRPQSASRCVSRLQQAPLSIGERVRKWVAEMKVDMIAPTAIIDLRKQFAVQPETWQKDWLRHCRASRKKLKTMFRARLCAKNQDYNQMTFHQNHGANTKPSRYIGCSCRTHPQSVDGSDGELVMDKASLLQSVKAHWDLDRFIEQGPAYLYQVWRGGGTGKNSVRSLAQELEGSYVIPDEKAALKYAKVVRWHEAKKRVVARIAGGNGDDAPLSSRAEGSENSDASDEEDIGEADDCFPCPATEITMDEDTNLLQLKVHLSDAQVRSLLKDRGEKEAGSSSAYLFTTQAVCIDNDVWLGLSGGFTHKVIRFVRNPLTHSVDSFVVAGMCWEKEVTDEGGKPTDPFRCKQCGNTRKNGNVIYALNRQGAISRGKYFCIVCGMDTLHVSLVKELRRSRPRWDPTIGQKSDPVPALSQEASAHPRKQQPARSGFPKSHLM